mmetsp:Transcript_68356/g.182115  ORF Transcript_68356/g.182115 Transcript_68356/m.182115 type:complete len:111 (+) Transcript_68356:327-659(+)
MRGCLVAVHAVFSVPHGEEMHEARQLASAHVEEACDIWSSIRRRELTWPKVEEIVGSFGDSVLDAGLKDLASKSDSERNLELSVWWETIVAWSRKRCHRAVALLRRRVQS